MRRNAVDIASTIVHEGTHVLDRLKPLDKFGRELSAYMMQHLFEKARGLNQRFANEFQVIQHVKELFQMHDPDNQFLIVVRELERMLSDRTASDFVPPGSSVGRIQTIASNLVEWLRRLDLTDPVPPFRVNLSKPFGQELIRVINENAVLSELLCTSGELISLSHAVSAEDRSELAAAIRSKFPPPEPMWR